VERWEYKTLRAKELDISIFSSHKTAVAIDEVLNELGRQGWELVEFNFGCLGGKAGIAGLLKRRRD
jgi:Domain of unknown function (DUF4177)